MSALANLMVILRMIKVFREDFIVSTISVALYYFFMNNAYWILSGKYLLVVRGNKYVMKNQPMPSELIQNTLKILFFGLVVNSLVPIAYGIYLFIVKLNPYHSIGSMDPQ